MKNLEALCAQYGYEIVKRCAPSLKLSKRDKAKLENTITKSLGVLQEEGMYACFLFLDYIQERKESYGAADIAAQAKVLLRHESVKLLGAGSDDFQALRQLSEDLDSLLLARQLLEQALIYARYHAKALKESP